ncbi:hypothetical protein GJA_1367 [Janthinobacterium agaricidamnosum NBRC 102515 = DSM 9628]|uniref:DUF7931 domain-containing protein n=1 Tax=Janthinobacterium agaricidamnosum NBRC 102515 = DSM 9628 TaxID=1349767 RepID=W0V364_9BURK|nr:hypothetical protein GJA_1367 [Janthinobacterium agaricidamnosum NBRC 102515 = DSM 9628]
MEFSSRKDFETQLQLCFSSAQSRLQLFDADFSLWQLGSSQTDVQLRRLLSGNGRIQLITHDQHYLERQQPRFLRLLKDFSHAVECRVTSRQLRQLSDSFCIADGHHMVRRFHKDQLRGVASTGNPEDFFIQAQRFDALWDESIPGLHVTLTGL